ncbi:hypothetical protein TraAM80_02839 [Trypanosoma rangeli]|uniref:Uncharacterized protein n=1 Tax=Trypanosoma rangeli TaxID=5698 RepID=A0A3S5IRR6_TRYRA|nr:uncharacterized protein TraAM80_02839 [Trypanosoma rangeli]RNF08379.1 hypothetical protein TraAM80_02839 [Trypanosoma rangeli]|eukprot:RNF08379.1 hypothetical protein TraAM80_02839 [Trypanosoma rangeli]
MRRGAHQKVAPPKKANIGVLLVHCAHPHSKTVSPNPCGRPSPAAKRPMRQAPPHLWASASVDASSSCGHAITVRNSGDRPVSSNTSPYRPRHWRIPQAEEVTPASSRPTTIIYTVNAVM